MISKLKKKSGEQANLKSSILLWRQFKRQLIIRIILEVSIFPLTINNFNLVVIDPVRSIFFVLRLYKKFWL